VLKVSKETDEEKAAFRFAAAFLAPAERLYKEIGNKRLFIQPEELLILKQRFGISVQALLYRLHDLGVITDSYYKKWCTDINRLKWRKHEPCEFLPERSQWLRRSVLRAFGESLLTKEEAEKNARRTIKDKRSSFAHREALFYEITLGRAQEVARRTSRQVRNIL
jgi:Zn-dependent peptidase ImmA (M78 family)